MPKGGHCGGINDMHKLVYMVIHTPDKDHVRSDRLVEKLEKHSGPHIFLSLS